MTLYNTGNYPQFSTSSPSEQRTREHDPRGLSGPADRHLATNDSPYNSILKSRRTTSRSGSAKKGNFNARPFAFISLLGS